MIMCRALSYEENTLDKSRLKSRCWRNMPAGTDFQTLPTSPMMEFLEPVLTGPVFWR